MNKQELHNLLLRSLDETLSAKEQNLLQQALANDEELQQLQTQYQQNEQALQQYEGDKIPYFAATVMRSINSQIANAENDLLAAIWKLFPRVALPALALTIALLVNVYVSEGALNVDTVMGIHDLTADDAAYLFQF